MGDVARFIEEVRACLGTRWRHQGRLPGVGLDCVGLVVVPAGRVGLRVADSLDYGLRPDGRLRAMVEAQMDPSPDPRPGDVLLFWAERPGVASHVGVMTSLGVIHTDRSVGRVVECSFSSHDPNDQLASRFDGAFKFREDSWLR